MKIKLKHLFRIFFLLVSAIVFLFVFFPEKCFKKNRKRKEKIVEKKRQSILKKRVYYKKEKIFEEDFDDEFEE